jgi:hypothetical protein
MENRPPKWGHTNPLRGYSLAPAPMYARYLGLLGPDETLEEQEMEFLEQDAMIEEDES